VGYTSWHPSGRLIAYSANKLSLFYHTVGETRDVYDAESNLGIYRVDQNRVVVPPAIARPDRQETWPSWSPDGKYLYFCSGPVLPLDRYREIRYDLVRIAYDIDKDAWGEVETLVSATKTGLSATQPRVSPDGRFLLFCMCQYGHFPIYHPDADLYLLSLATGKLSRLDINSSEADTWHCWSSNGRWIVFSSKRDQLFFVDMPYASEREAIWRIQIAKHGRDWKSFDLRQLAKATEGLTGSEIEAVFVEALYQACDEEQEPTDLTIAGILNDFVPLSKTMAEQIAGLRTWAKGRARFATTSVAESKIRRLAA
jgi:dipeptidyl aminopeptidase/acylaminoacyl peptidase